MTENELTPDDVENLLETFAAANPGSDIDPGRLRAVLDEAMGHLSKGHPLAEQINDLTSAGASLFICPSYGGWLELRLGWPDDPELWPKVHGRSFLLGTFALADVQARPQG